MLGFSSGRELRPLRGDPLFTQNGEAQLLLPLNEGAWGKRARSGGQLWAVDIAPRLPRGSRAEPHYHGVRSERGGLR